MERPRRDRKPAALDFGPEAEREILEPETARSYEVGVKGRQLDGFNLTDERDPVAESELGDAQYYRLPARNVRLTWAARF